MLITSLYLKRTVSRYFELVKRSRPTRVLHNDYQIMQYFHFEVGSDVEIDYAGNFSHACC
jgi:hypothetical protein